MYMRVLMFYFLDFASLCRPITSYNSVWFFCNTFFIGISLLHIESKNWDLNTWLFYEVICLCPGSVFKPMIGRRPPFSSDLLHVFRSLCCRRTQHKRVGIRLWDASRMWRQHRNAVWVLCGTSCRPSTAASNDLQRHPVREYPPNSSVNISRNESRALWSSGILVIVDARKMREVLNRQ